MRDLEPYFYDSPYYSRKHHGYLPIYSSLLSRFARDDELSLVEVGVLEGGSLFMWRSFFPKARIIGIDLNPDAKKWESHGFEIYIGNQGDPKFWKDFFRSVGMIDLLIDDGGHTSLQQSTTLTCSLESVRDGGLMIFEDTHTSYQREFGGPSKHSFTESAQRLVHGLSGVDASRSVFSSHVRSIAFFTSVIAFEIGREGPESRYEVIENEGARDFAGDFRYRGTNAGNMVNRVMVAARSSKLPFLRLLDGLMGILIRRFGRLVFTLAAHWDNRLASKRMRALLSRSIES